MYVNHQFIIPAEYTKVDGYSCETIDRVFRNLNEAKRECTSDSGCTWILDKGCKNEFFYLCAHDDVFSQADESCVYSKKIVKGKYHSIT